MLDGLWRALGENPSATVLLGFVVVILASGLFFVPRWMVNVMLRGKDAELRRKDEEIARADARAERYREAWDLSEKGRAEERRQGAEMLRGMKELSESMTLVTSIVKAIRTIVSSPHLDVEEHREP
jgi:hypothetical protein